MAILVINAGSSSVKFTLFAQDGRTVRAGGIVERIGLPGTRLACNRRNRPILEEEVAVGNADEAVGAIVGALTHSTHGVIQSVADVTAVGHRVVHGGERLTQPVVVDGAIRDYLVECCRFAPLHNPHNIRGIDACRRHMPGAVQVAVFDTAFHTTIPRRAFLYGIPMKYYEEDHVRRYGFHGVSHKHVSEEAARFLNEPVAGLHMITCHLGNGCSMTAVAGGRSVDTSMGFTPLEGLLMGTRCGDIDAAAVLHLMELHRIGPAEMSEMLNKQSGLLGLAGIGSNDVRDIIAAAGAGNRRAALALDIFCYRIRKYIGAFTAAMGRLDVLVFTAGIGENSPEVRRRVCAGLEAPEGLGIVLDPQKNQAAPNLPRSIHAQSSRVRVLVIPTNEELEIARETLKLMGDSLPGGASRPRPEAFVV